VRLTTAGMETWQKRRYRRETKRFKNEKKEYFFQEKLDRVSEV